LTSLVDPVVRCLGYLSRRSPKGKVKFAKTVRAVLGHHRVEYVDQWGYRRVADLHDEYDALGFAGDPRLPRHIAALIEPGDWVVDVGANVGLMAAPLCRLVGPGGLVWAVEPLPRNFERLEFLKDRNRIDQLRLFQGGLGAADGRAHLGLPPEGDSGLGSLVAGVGTAGAIEVQTWALDSLLAQNPSDRPLRFLKLDVEGFEPEVLKGAARTLREHRPRVYCEINDPLLRRAGSSAAGLMRAFADLGYAPAGPAPDLDGPVFDCLLLPGEGVSPAGISSAPAGSAS
jgi:FkbM family methyltransferase